MHNDPLLKPIQRTLSQSISEYFSCIGAERPATGRLCLGDHGEVVVDVAVEVMRSDGNADAGKEMGVHAGGRDAQGRTVGRRCAELSGGIGQQLFRHSHPFRMRAASG